MTQSAFHPNQDSPIYPLNTNKPPRRSCLPGCLGTLVVLVIVLAIVGGIGVAILAVFLPNALNGIMASLTGISVPQTRSLPGNVNASAFDPIETFAAVADLAGSDAQLTSMTATNVRSDGTLDLNATYSPAPRVDYKFVHEVPRPADAPPVGAGGTGTGSWYEAVSISVYHPGERRHVREVSGGVSVSYDYVNDGMEREVDKPTTSLPDPIVAPPKCSFASLWRVALEHKATKDAVAQIDYRSDGYSFTISALRVYLKFGLDCRLQG